jgi:hypothetical protein
MFAAAFCGAKFANRWRFPSFPPFVSAAVVQNSPFAPTLIQIVLFAFTLPDVLNPAFNSVLSLVFYSALCTLHSELESKNPQPFPSQGFQ